MQRFILTVIMAVETCFATAQSVQPVCNKNIYNCAEDFVDDLFTDAQIISVSNISYARFGGGSPDASYYSASNPYLSDCGEANSCSFDGEALTYDVYYPSVNAYPCYSLKPLPAIFLFRGSGFSDCNDSTETMASYCMAFAKRGFVAFNVNYRTGRTKNPTGALSASQLLAMYRSFQDGRGAIRTVIAQNGKFPYRIDTANIFVGGASAGGEISLNMAYSLSERMNEEIFPGIAKVLGPIDANYYKGPPRIRFSIKGVLNLWGAAFLTGKKDPATFIKQNPNNPPLIAFHGMQDSTLWITSQKVPLSNKAPYNYDYVCLLPDSLGHRQIYFIPSDVRTLYQCGSSALYDILKNQLNISVQSELYLDSDMGHGLSWKSDFGYGTGKISKDSLIIYFAQRAATFFQALVNKKAKYLRRTEFTDCVNNRNKACTIGNLSEDDDCETIRINGLTTINASSNKSLNVFDINQSSKNIFVHFSNAANENIYLYNLNGVLVKKQRTDATTVTINCSNLIPGIYLLVVSQGVKTEKHKIVLL